MSKHGLTKVLKLAPKHSMPGLEPKTARNSTVHWPGVPKFNSKLALWIAYSKFFEPETTAKLMFTLQAEWLSRWSAKKKQKRQRRYLNHALQMRNHIDIILVKDIHKIWNWIVYFLFIYESYDRVRIFQKQS